jgi:haloacetate dehalogenase
MIFEEFESLEVKTEGTTIFLRCGGSGAPALLLHGFPQTHLMWRNVAPLLARNFTVVCADLRGYGYSGCPVSTADHATYSKRAMAQDMVAVMSQLGFPRFSVAGHDRGGRVAYRMALDHADHVTRLALAFWPWSLLAQPEPLPERILTAVPEAIIDHALGQWGSPASVFTSQVRAAYVEALRNPDHAHAICEEYRAAASIDREHDKADCASGRRIVCALLALWSELGPLDEWYAGESGPVALWRDWCDDVQGHALNAGHFFPEEAPEETAEALRRFFGNKAGSSLYT